MSAIEAGVLWIAKAEEGGAHRLENDKVSSTLARVEV